LLESIIIIETDEDNELRPAQKSGKVKKKIKMHNLNFVTNTFFFFIDGIGFSRCIRYGVQET
jgi:hypothetical protein